MTARILELAAIVGYWFLSPMLVAIAVARATAQRAIQEGARDAARPYARWFLLPWLVYLANVLVGAAHLPRYDAALENPVALVAVVLVALVPVLLITLVVRQWGRTIGHPAGGVRIGVEARGWLVNAAFLAAICAVIGPLVAVAPLAGWGSAVVTICAGLVFYPDIFRWTWKAYPLGDDDVARRIRILLDEQCVSVRGVLVIPRALGATANAFASGIIDRRRYLFVTEPLLDDFPVEEIDAVVAHEIGHLRRHHVARAAAVNLTTLAITVAVLAGLLSLVDGRISAGSERSLQAACGALAVFTALFAMRRSLRRFEFEADDFSAEVLGTGAPLAHALRRMARENWLPQTGSKSVAMASHPTVERRIQRLLHPESPMDRCPTPAPRQ